MITLTLKGTRDYWYHPGLVRLIQNRTGWSEGQTKNFLAANEQVNFNRLQKRQAAEILDELEGLGFVISLAEKKQTLTASLAIPFENDLGAVRQQLGELLLRVKKLEESRGQAPERVSIKESPVYQELWKNANQDKPGPENETRESRAGSVGESNIGKYWLSRIGIFTLVLGIGLFISYSFQFIGAFGKVATGIAIGVFLVGSANFMARYEAYRRWAMAMIGGGWAILYFTVYAAHNVAATRVITDPYLGFVCLIAVIIGSVSQSLRYKSAVLVFFSYFLGFVAITMGGVSFYTLAASFLIGLSVVVVTQKTGWNWLALLGLAAVYLVHYFWLEPSLYWLNEGWPGQESVWDALALPWAGNEWKIYPLNGLEKSVFHQAFLVLYWVLFTCMGFFGKEETGKDINLRFALLSANNFLFVSSYIHHLHVYYPGHKHLFTFIMSVIFLLLFAVEERSRRKFVADFYLASSVLLMTLTIPMYFDGPWISYGWSGGAIVLAWLASRYDRRVLTVLAWFLSLLVAWRLVVLDYLEQRILFDFIMPFREAFFAYMGAAVAFFIIAISHQRSQSCREQEKDIAQNVFMIASAAALGAGFLLGGLRASASVVWLIEAIGLVYLGIKRKQLPLRVAGLAFLGLSLIRLDAVDCDLGFKRMFADPEIFARLWAVIWVEVALISAADWVRRIRLRAAMESWLFPILSVAGAFLIIRYFYDPAVSSWISIIWGAFAFIFIICGFNAREKTYRWIGLGLFVLVLLRLFFHDFSKLETIYRIISFMGLGAVFIAASFLYSYYSRTLLADSKDQKNDEAFGLKG